MKVVKKILIAGAIVFGLLLMGYVTFFAMPEAFGKATSHAPKDGDWVCWYEANEKEHCGAYAYSGDKKYAEKLASELCEMECASDCRLDYCEKL